MAADNHREECVLLAHLDENEELVVRLILDYESTEDGWEGECADLGVATTADTLEEAREELVDLVLLYLNSIAEDEDLRTYLNEREVRHESPAAQQEEQAVRLLAVAGITA